VVLAMPRSPAKGDTGQWNALACGDAPARVQLCSQGALAGAWLGYVTAGVTPKAGERTSKVLHDLTEIP
jgi:hypothetical protein